MKSFKKFGLVLSFFYLLLLGASSSSRIHVNGLSCQSGVQIDSEGNVTCSETFFFEQAVEASSTSISPEQHLKEAYEPKFEYISYAFQLILTVFIFFILILTIQSLTSK